MLLTLTYCAFNTHLNLVLFSLRSGWRDHQDHEGLHQHDGEETLQHHVSDQRRQLLGQVIAADQSEPSVHFIGYRRLSIPLPCIGQSV